MRFSRCCSDNLKFETAAMLKKHGFFCSLPNPVQIGQADYKCVPMDKKRKKMNLRVKFNGNLGRKSLSKIVAQLHYIFLDLNKYSDKKQGASG